MAHNLNIRDETVADYATPFINPNEGDIPDEEEDIEVALH